MDYGKHSFRFGGDWRINQYLQIGNEFARGRFTATEASPETRIRCPAAIRERTFSWAHSRRSKALSRSPRGDFRNNEWGIYVDDTYKVTPKLTINWGLRWEVYQPLLDKFGLQTNFQLKQALPSYANEPDPAKHPTLVRTGSGGFYETSRFASPVRCSLPAMAVSAI